MKKYIVLVLCLLTVLSLLTACGIGSSDSGFTGVDHSVRPAGGDLTGNGQSEASVSEPTGDEAPVSDPTGEDAPAIPESNPIESVGDENASPSLADMMRSGYGLFNGIVREGRYYHDGQDEWFVYYFADVGEAQLESLKNGMDDYYDTGEYAKTEIQLYSTDGNITLKDYIGKEIMFGGEWFAAHTVHHRRDIVFEVKEIYDAYYPPDGDYAPAVFKTFGTPLSPSIVERGTPCYFNGCEFAYQNYLWAEYEDGSGEYCLMILVDAAEPETCAIDALYLPGYGLPVVGRNRHNIYIKWTNPAAPEETVELMFEEQSGQMTIFANALKGIKQRLNQSDVVAMPVSVYRDDSEYDRYYIPLYAILNEIGGGVVCDAFNMDGAYIFSGAYTQSYTGFWETSDRSEYRADAVIDGKTQSIASYWNGLELRADGMFTESYRIYQDEGDWVLTEKTGLYVFWGRMLVMLYETESERRGVEYTALVPYKIEEPVESYVFGWYIEDWDTDYLSICGKFPLFRITP